MLTLKTTEVCVSSARFRKCVDSLGVFPLPLSPTLSLQHRESFLKLYHKKTTTTPFLGLSVSLLLPRQFGEVGDNFGVVIFLQQGSFWLVLSSGCKPKLGSMAGVCLNSPLRGKCRRTRNVGVGMRSPMQSQVEGCLLTPLR